MQYVVQQFFSQIVLISVLYLLYVQHYLTRSHHVISYFSHSMFSLYFTFQLLYTGGMHFDMLDSNYYNHNNHNNSVDSLLVGDSDNEKDSGGVEGELLLVVCVCCDV